MDRGARWTTVLGAAKHQMTERQHFHFHMLVLYLRNIICNIWHNHVNSTQFINNFQKILLLIHIPCSLKISVQFSHSVVSNSLWLHGLQRARLPCPPSTPRACSNSCPLSQWCHTTVSSSVGPFSHCLQSFSASGSFPKSQFFASGGQSIGASALASVLPMSIQDYFL